MQDHPSGPVDTPQRQPEAASQGAPACPRCGEPLARLLYGLPADRDRPPPAGTVFAGCMVGPETHACRRCRRWLTLTPDPAPEHSRVERVLTAFRSRMPLRRTVQTLCLVAIVLNGVDLLLIAHLIGPRETIRMAILAAFVVSMMANLVAFNVLWAHGAPRHWRRARWLILLGALASMADWLIVGWPGWLPGLAAAILNVTLVVLAWRLHASIGREARLSRPG